MSRGFDQILKQARKIQEQFQKLQEEAAHRTVEAQAGGGMVTCIVNGKQEILSIKISDEVWEEKDKELLEDLIVAAVNEGLNKSREMVQEEIAKITGMAGLNLPFSPF
ncbi:MAG: YbaB/EbfC family nucleoid-associated protein [Deltaproteobacteria bacterium]|nr:YbaB/EbfC family nucleoid-associated protein [Deltaproteobacteria bacterium]